jgi:nucleoside-diphosphate-sugar epimerase
LGANGRFGRAATHAFATAGWQVRAATRNGTGEAGPNITHVACDATDRAAVIAAAQGADIIVHALNPPYHHWARLLPVHTANVISAGLSSGATVMMPSNIYRFGKDAGEVLCEAQAPTPTTRKGALRVTMERAFEAAAAQGLCTVILRGGDFIERTQTGNWFDSHIANKVYEGKFTYPGRMDAVHAWAYLPDMARAMVGLAQRRASLPRYATFGFEGFSLTGTELLSAVECAARRPLKRRRMPWGLLRAVALFSPLMREVLEVRYLWDTQHRIDGADLRAALPDFVPTPLDRAMEQVLAR